MLKQAEPGRRLLMLQCAAIVASTALITLAYSWTNIRSYLPLQLGAALALVSSVTIARTAGSRWFYSLLFGAIVGAATMLASITVLITWLGD